MLSITFDSLQIFLMQIHYQKLFAFLEKSHAYEAHYRSSGGTTSNGGGWVKRTPEDLSQLLTSFREIQEKLSTATSAVPPPTSLSTVTKLQVGNTSKGDNSPVSTSTSSLSSSATAGSVGGCRCWHDQLVSKVAQVFPYCTAPIISTSASSVNSGSSSTNIIIANSSGSGTTAVIGTSNTPTHGCLF